MPRINSIRMRKVTPASVATPPALCVTLFVDTEGSVQVKDCEGRCTPVRHTLLEGMLERGFDIVSAGETPGVTIKEAALAGPIPVKTRGLKDILDGGLE